MKNSFFHTIICCLLSLSLTAQQNNSLGGKVLFLNSGKKPAVGVEVSGTIKDVGDANPVYSANDGAYRLVFPKAGVGHLVDLKVGDTDAHGQAIELVNEKEIGIWRIPENSEDAFEIIVCRKGERDLIAQRYYKVIKTSADRELAKKKAEWAALLDEKEKDYEKIAELSERITELEKQVDSIPLYKEAYRIASINKDNATKRVLKYLELLDKGKSIQEARKVLHAEKAIDELEAGTLTFNAAIEELETRASASKSIFDYKDAIRCYDTIIHYAKRMGIDRLKIAWHYNQVAHIHLENGNYKTALGYLQKSMDIREEVLDSKHGSLAAIYNNISVVYQNLSKYEIALEYGEKSINVWKANSSSKRYDLAIFYMHIAMTHRYLGRYKTALIYYQKTIDIWEEILDPKHFYLATAYNGKGNVHNMLKQYETALEYQHKALNIYKDTLVSKNLLAVIYNDIGTTYQGLDEYKKALKYYKKTIDIREGILSSRHPHLANSYNNMASIYLELDLYQDALEYFQKAIDIWETTLPPKHANLAIVYNNIARAYKSLDRYKTALNYQQKALDILKEILNLKHPYLISSYGNIATIYHHLGQYKKTLEYQKKVISIKEEGNKEGLDPKHIDLARAYHNISNTYRILGKYKKALNYQEKCLTILKETLPRNHLYYSYIYPVMAVTYYDKKDYLKAIEIYQKLKVLFPEKYQQFYNRIGLAYAKNKQFKEAATAFKAYQKLYPNKGRAYRNWAMYHALKGEKEKALSMLQKAVKLGYNDIKWFKTDDSMDSLRNEKVFIGIVEKLEKEK